MSEVAFIVSIPQLAKGDAGNFIDIGNELVRLLRKDTDRAGVTLVQILKSDKVLALSEYAAATAAPPTNPLTTTNARTGKTTTTVVGIAGGAAGDHTVTGIKTTDTLLAVAHVDDTTHVATDKTSEYTISAADTINNTGKTASTGARIVVTYVRT